MEDAGLPLALVPEAAGGVGLEPQEAFEIIRLSGYRALPLPLGETMMARALWQGAGGAAEPVDGRPVLLATAPGGPAAMLRGSGPARNLSGRTAPLRIGEAAPLLLLHARDAQGADHLVLVDSRGCRGTALADTGFEACVSVDLASAAIGAGAVLPWTAARAWTFQAHGALVRSLQMMGAMQRAADFFRFTGRTELLGDARFTSLADRVQHIDFLYSVVEQQAPSFTCAEWQAFCDRASIPCMPVRSLDEVLTDEHLRAVGFFTLHEHPTEGAYRVVRSPVRFAAPFQLRHHAPRLGEDTVAVLEEAGLAGEDIAQLLRSGIVKLPSSQG